MSLPLKTPKNGLYWSLVLSRRLVCHESLSEKQKKNGRFYHSTGYGTAALHSNSDPQLTAIFVCTEVTPMKQIKTKKEITGYVLLFEAALYLCACLGLWMAVFTPANIAMWAADIFASILNVINCVSGSAACM